MKKTMSLILVLLMLFSMVGILASCSGQETAGESGAADGGTLPPSENKEPVADLGSSADAAQNAQDALDSGAVTEEMLNNSKPNEYVFEKIAAGQDVHIGISFISLGDEFTKMYTDGLKADFEALGFTASISDAQGDPVLQLEQIENYVTMKAAGIVTLVVDTGAYESVYATCKEQGTYFAMFANLPQTWKPDMCAPMDQTQLGTQVCNLLFAWLDIRYPDAEPGGLHTAILGKSGNEEDETRFAAFKDVVVTDPRINVTFILDNVFTLDEGYTAAESALSFDPDIRIFLANSGTALAGVDNYIKAQPQYDLADFGGFTTGLDNTAMQLIEEAKTDGSMFRGIIATGYDTLWGAIFRGMIMLFEGEVEAPYVYWERMYAMASFDYYYDSDDER